MNGRIATRLARRHATWSLKRISLVKTTMSIPASTLASTILSRSLFLATILHLDSTKQVVLILILLRTYISNVDTFQFENADLHPVMKENVALCRYSVPTPVQASMRWDVFGNNGCQLTRLFVSCSDTLFQLLPQDVILWHVHKLDPARQLHFWSPLVHVSLPTHEA